MTNEVGLTTYQIEIVETMSHIVEVMATDDSSAILQARTMYRKEDVELFYDDLIDTKFNIFDKNSVLHAHFTPLSLRSHSITLD